MQVQCEAVLVYNLEKVATLYSDPLPPQERLYKVSHSIDLTFNVIQTEKTGVTMYNGSAIPVFHAML